MNIKLYVYAGTKRYDITNFVDQIEWSGDYQSACRELQFGVLASPTDPSIKAVRCELMDLVSFYVDGNLLFTGKIWARHKATGSNTIDVTCFDAGIYLKRNKASVKFKGKTAKQILKSVCSQYGIKVGDVADPKNKITRNFLGVDLYAIIATAYTLASKKTNKKYHITFVGEKLSVYTKEYTTQTPVIEGKVNLMDAAISESAEKIVNAVVIYSKNNNYVKTIQDKASVSEYGRLTGYLKQSDKDNKTDEAKEMLQENGLEQKITVNTLGDTRFVTGKSVVVKEPYTGISGYFWIDRDIHTWKNGQYYNKLTLNFKRIMNDTESGSKPT